MQYEDVEVGAPGRGEVHVNVEAHPVEDATVVWDEHSSPFVTVATVAAHRPLGSVNRVREAIYKHSAQFREHHNSRPIQQPCDACLPA